MSDPTTTPVPFSWTALPTQLFGAVPAWLWRYAGGTVLIFGLAFSGDYYLGQPLTAWVRAWGEQKAKAVSLPTPVADARMIARIEALEKQAANRVQTFSDIDGRFALNESNLKALELIVEYNVGRTIRLEEASKKKPAPVKSVPAPVAKTEAVKPAEPVAPMVQIGGAP